MSVSHPIDEPGGGMTDLMDQRVSETISRIADFLGEFYPGISLQNRDFLLSRHTVPRRLPHLFIPQDLQVVGELLIKDGVIVETVQSGSKSVFFLFEILHILGCWMRKIIQKAAFYFTWKTRLPWIGLLFVISRFCRRFIRREVGTFRGV